MKPILWLKKWLISKKHWDENEEERFIEEIESRLDKEITRNDRKKIAELEETLHYVHADKTDILKAQYNQIIEWDR